MELRLELGKDGHVQPLDTPNDRIIQQKETLMTLTVLTFISCIKYNLSQPWSLWNLQTWYACYSICGPCSWKYQQTFRNLISMKSIDRVCLLLYRLWAMLVKRSTLFHSPDLYEIYRQLLLVTLYLSHSGEKINTLSQPSSLWNLQTAFACYSICEPCWWKDQHSFTALISMKSTGSFCLLLFIWAILVKRSTLFHNPHLYEIYRQFLLVTLYVSHAGEKTNTLSQPWSLWNLQTAFACYSICEPFWWKDQHSFTILISMKSTDSFCLLLYMWAMLVKRSTIFHSPDLYEIYRQLCLLLFVWAILVKRSTLFHNPHLYEIYRQCLPVTLYVSQAVERSIIFHSPHLYEIYRQLLPVTLYVSHAGEKIN